MDWLAAVSAISIMVTVVVALFAFYGASVPAQAVSRRLEGLMAGTSVVESVGAAAALRESGMRRGMFSGLSQGDLGDKLTLQLERADLNISPGEFITARLVFAAIGVAAPFFLIGGLVGVVVAIPAAGVGYLLPKFYLNHKRKSRVAALNAQLPEALMIISNALKAGFGLLQALSNAADNLSHPISTELGRTIHEMNIGSSAEEAMLGLSERAGSYDLDIVITAILVQRTVGGNLGEILDTVAGTMRERIRIRGEIQTLTAQQKLTGLVIGALPIGVGLLLQVMSPGFVSPLFFTMMGKMMLTAAVVLEVVGILVIQRILNIEV